MSSTSSTLAVGGIGRSATQCFFTSSTLESVQPRDFGAAVEAILGGCAISETKFAFGTAGRVGIRIWDIWDDTLFRFCDLGFHDESYRFSSIKFPSFSSKSCVFACGSQHNSVKIWNDSGENLRTFVASRAGGRGQVRSSLCYDVVSKWLYFASRNLAVRWDVETGKSYAFKPPRYDSTRTNVYGVALDPEMRLFYVCPDFQQPWMTVYDTRQKAPIDEFGVTMVSSPAGSLHILADRSSSNSSSMLIMQYASGQVAVYDVRQRCTYVQSFRVHRPSRRSAMFSDFVRVGPELYCSVNGTPELSLWSLGGMQKGGGGGRRRKRRGGIVQRKNFDQPLNCVCCGYRMDDEVEIGDVLMRLGEALPFFEDRGLFRVQVVTAGGGSVVVCGWKWMKTS